MKQIDDLVRREEAINTIEELIRKVNDGDGYGVVVGTDALRRIRGLPSIDAVPVIRCKDCIHSTSQVSDDEDNYYCNAMRRCMHSLDFCSYAERKE